MRHWLRHSCIALCCVALAAAGADALESDQFTVPAEPLVDIGHDVSWLVWDELHAIVERTNAQIADDRHKAEISSTKIGRRYRLRQIEKFSSERYLAHELYHVIGRGFPEVRIEVLVQDLAHAHPIQPAIYETSFGESIYSGSALARPLNVVGVVPTVKVHGVYMGTDKLGHVFQQGYEYYDDFLDEEEDGGSLQACYREAVDGGVGQENGIYGRIPSGTYSNADLASNFAGLKFYLSLTSPVRIGDRILPPLLVLDEAHGWQWNPDAYERWGGGLLKPFISEHFSEAKNPAHYDWTMRGGIRDAVHDRGAAWVAFHHTNRQREISRLSAMTTWFGEDYGHSGWEDVITIVNAYFESLDDAPAVAKAPAEVEPAREVESAAHEEPAAAALAQRDEDDERTPPDAASMLDRINGRTGD